MTELEIKKALLPVWEGDTVTDESLTFIRDKSGFASAPLLYDPESIISVTSATGRDVYEEGRDFVMTDSGIALTENSRIFAFNEDELYPAEPIEGHTFPMEVGNVLFYEGTFYHERQVSVTYKAKEKITPALDFASKAHLLPRSHAKLKSGTLNLCVFGDSISVGANASGFTGIEPFCPTYAELFRRGLELKYGAKVEYHNPSKGGMNSKWGTENAESLIKPVMIPDLAIVAFGGNDSPTPVETFVSNIKSIMKTIRGYAPECEFICTCTSLPNKLLSSDKARFYGNQYLFEEPMLALEKEGVAIADITHLQTQVLTRKRFIDMTGNNVNHPNDFFHRLYAQYYMTIFD